VTVSAIAPITGYYDYSEVTRSVVIAIAASYAALDLTGRVAAANGRIRLAWLSGGAIAMGIGIWTMHLKGMLAFSLPVPVEYHWPTLLAGLSVAIFASAVALYVTSRQNMSRADALVGSIVMGSGIAGLHYTAMAAMRLPAITRSLLKMSFAQRVDHSKRAARFVVLGSARPPSAATEGRDRCFTRSAPAVSGYGSG
jgi:NO-binding membrane sensor protein with MHYT domain